MKSHNSRNFILNSYIPFQQHYMLSSQLFLLLNWSMGIENQKLWFLWLYEKLDSYKIVKTAYSFAGKIINP